MVILAPSDGAALNKPSPSDPTFRISSAKTGSKATAPPNNTEKRSRESAFKITLFLNTNFTPSINLFEILSLATWGITGFDFIFRIAASAITVNIKTSKNVFVIPREV